jgi:hypothetical protein
MSVSVSFRGFVIEGHNTIKAPSDNFKGTDRTLLSDSPKACL